MAQKNTSICLQILNLRFQLQMQWNSNIRGLNVQVCFGITIYALVWRYDVFWYIIIINSSFTFLYDLALLGLQLLFMNRVNFSTRDFNALPTMQTQRTSAVFSMALISVLKLSSDQTSEWSSCFCKVLGHDQLFLSPYHNSTCTCLFTSLSGWKISFPLWSGQTRVQYHILMTNLVRLSFCAIRNSTSIIFFSTKWYPV